MPVLDTNLLIRASQGEPVAADVIRSLAARGEALLVPAMAAIEFLAGEENVTPTYHWLKEGFVVVHTTDDQVRRAAELYAAAHRQGRGRPGWGDSMIAAVASLEGTYVVTTNKRHFTQFGVPAWHYDLEEEPPQPG